MPACMRLSISCRKWNTDAIQQVVKRVTKEGKRLTGELLMNRCGRGERLARRPIVEYFGDGEGHDAIARCGGDDNFLVKRVKNDSNVARLAAQGSRDF